MKASAQMLKPENQVPLYLQLSNLLRQSILARPEAEGKLMSIRKIAAHYRVSPMTVVKAVDHLKAEGLLCSQRGRGLFFNTRNRRAAPPTAAPTKIIGVTFLDAYNISSAFISEVIQGLSETAAARNMRLEIFSTPSDAGFMENSFFAGIIREKRLDGMILATRMPLRDVALLQTTGIPFVWINVDIPGENVCCVCSAKIESLNIALLHLKKLGHKKIALLCAEEDLPIQSALRTLGAGYGMNCRFLFQPGPELEMGYILAQRAVNEIKPDVLLTRGSDLTASALSYLAEAHLRVPDDLALVGILSGRRQPFVPRNITFVHSDANGMAQRAVLLLEDLMKDDQVKDRKIYLPPEFVIRGSCGFPMHKKNEIKLNNIEDLKRLSYP